MGSRKYIFDFWCQLSMESGLREGTCGECSLSSASGVAAVAPKSLPPRGWLDSLKVNISAHPPARSSYIYYTQPFCFAYAFAQTPNLLSHLAFGNGAHTRLPQPPGVCCCQICPRAVFSFSLRPHAHIGAEPPQREAKCRPICTEDEFVKERSAAKEPDVLFYATAELDSNCANYIDEKTGT